jgi:hypothetical protein
MMFMAYFDRVVQSWQAYARIAADKWMMPAAGEPAALLHLHAWHVLLHSMRQQYQLALLQ